MSKDDGGPAYPAPEAAKARFGDSNPDAFLGMSLRDYFAAKAMQAMIANNWPITGEDGACAAGTAYQMADTMLAARSA
jgi:hypothetical protein